MISNPRSRIAPQHPQTGDEFSDLGTGNIQTKVASQIAQRTFRREARDRVHSAGSHQQKSPVSLAHQVSRTRQLPEPTSHLRVTLNLVRAARQRTSHSSPFAMSPGIANKIITTPYLCQYRGKKTSSGLAYTPKHNCHDTHYVYRSLDYHSVTLRYSGLFSIVGNSPVQGQVVTIIYVSSQLLAQSHCQSISLTQRTIHRLLYHYDPCSFYGSTQNISEVFRGFDFGFGCSRGLYIRELVW